jgi:hypothetical protein
MAASLLNDVNTCDTPSRLKMLSFHQRPHMIIQIDSQCDISPVYELYWLGETLLTYLLVCGLSLSLSLLVCLFMAVTLLL